MSWDLSFLTHPPPDPESTTMSVTSSPPLLINSTSTVSEQELYAMFDDISNTTTNGTDTTPVYIGYISAGVAVLFYGSNFIPVKKFETGDGMFFQLVLCTAILFVGIVVNIIRNAPKFYPFVMVGGAIWATGNVFVVPIIKTIGMGLGLCIWGCTNLLSGWATGRFGAFGFINPEVPSNVGLNYAGVALAVLSASVYLFVRSEVSTSIEITVNSTDDERDPLLPTQAKRNSIPKQSLSSLGSGSFGASVERDGSVNPAWLPEGPIADKLNKSNQSADIFLERLSPMVKRVIGSVLSLISGVLYGICFAPAIHVQDKVEGASANGLDYVFAHFTGIFAASVVYFMIYAAIMKNEPKVYPKVIMPALLSGLMWGVATTCWFVANKALSEPVSFPIITTGPGVVASIWGILVFKEIRGHRNLVLLSIAFCLTLACGVLAGMSDA